MPYRLSRGEPPDFSVERASLYGFLVGLTALAPALYASFEGGLLGVTFFAAVMAVMHRNMIVFLAPWAVVLPMAPFLALFFVAGPPVVPVAALFILCVFVVAMTAPAYNHDPTPLLTWVVAGTLLAVLLGILVVGSPLPPHEVTVAEMFEGSPGVGVVSALVLGFPAFGACYGAGLVLMHEDEQEEG